MRAWAVLLSCLCVWPSTGAVAWQGGGHSTKHDVREREKREADVQKRIRNRAQTPQVSNLQASVARSNSAGKGKRKHIRALTRPTLWPQLDGKTFPQQRIAGGLVLYAGLPGSVDVCPGPAKTWGGAREIMFASTDYLPAEGATGQAGWVRAYRVNRGGFQCANTAGESGMWDAEEVERDFCHKGCGGLVSNWSYKGVVSIRHAICAPKTKLEYLGAYQCTAGTCDRQRLNFLQCKPGSKQRTPRPSQAPTTTPTKLPTLGPTGLPTSSPTALPTRFLPVSAPTARPSAPLPVTSEFFNDASPGLSL